MPVQNQSAPSVQLNILRPQARTPPSRAPSPQPRRSLPTSPYASSANLARPQNAGSELHARFDVKEPASVQEKRTWGGKDVKGLGGRVIGHRWFAWIPTTFHWTALRPVVRCAVALWLCWILQLIPQTHAMLGYAAYFIEIVAVILPPWQSVLENIESYANLFFFCGLAWAWSCLAIFIADRVRVPTDPARIAAAEQSLAPLAGTMQFAERLIYDGTYIQTAPTIVCGVFLAFGTAALLCYKLKTQPSPATLPIVLACILMDVCLITAHFYPDARYQTGLLFFLPMSISAGICILSSLVIFPESVGHAFRGKFRGVLTPLASSLRSVEELFEQARDHSSDADSDPEAEDRIEEWAAKGKDIRLQLLSSLAGIPPLRAQQRYLDIDLSYSCLSGNDLRDIFDLVAIVQARSSGLAFFFDVLVNNARHSHLDSSVYSVRELSRTTSRVPSRPASVRESNTPTEDPTQDRSYFMRAFNIKRNSGIGGHKGSHLSLFENMTKAQQPVGMYEVQRYMELEKAYQDQTVNILAQLDLLATSSLPLVRACRESLAAIDEWLRLVDKRRPLLQEQTGRLQSALDDYHTERLQTIKPFRHIFDPSQSSDNADPRFTHFRAIFQSFAGQYHLIEFSEALLRLTRRIEEIDAVRTKRRFWYPNVRGLVDHFRNHQEHHVTDGAEGHDNDPAFNPEVDDVLGEVRKRNPEYKPFSNPVMRVLASMASITDISHSRSLMYAIKAGVMTGVATLPGFIASSSSFYYYNRGVWVAIMAQLTLAVFSGDTTFALVKRLVATFWGIIFGMVAWYIGSGGGPGNPYGLAAIGLVAFPMMMLFRIHFPGGVLTAVMGPVSAILVLGYSYLNGQLVQLTDATWGWDVAWRRFVTVSIGITVAWIFSYLPPSYSARRAIRYSYSQSISAVGSILADVLSHANDYHHTIDESVETRQKLLTWRAKLSKLGLQHTHATYEYSLRGKWPEKRYAALLETLQDTMALLSQLHHILSQLDRPWRQAVLERTRFAEHAFLGDVLAVITLCATSLSAATPIPQITPSPLVARYRAGKVKGLDVPDVSDDLPHLVTVEVLESSAYMRYALAISTSHSFFARLDRLVLLCKMLLGESYHISGVHLDPQHNRV